MDAEVDEISLRAYARHRGVALSAVQKAIRYGRISKTPGGKINPVTADREWECNTDISRRPADACLPTGCAGAAFCSDDADLDISDTPDLSVGSDYQRHRANRERIRAEKEQIELDMLAGRSVDLAEAQRLAFTAFRSLRDAVLNVSPRIKDALAAETDPLKVETMLDAELAVALQAVDVEALLQGKEEDEIGSEGEEDACN